MQPDGPIAKSHSNSPTGYRFGHLDFRSSSNPIAEAINYFTGDTPKVIEGSRGMMHHQVDRKNFFGVAHANLKEIDFAVAKPTILEKMGLPADTTFVSVLTDSYPFSPRGVEAAEVFLGKTLSPKEALLIDARDPTVHTYVEKHDLWGRTLACLNGSSKRELFPYKNFYLVHQGKDPHISLEETDHYSGYKLASRGICFDGDALRFSQIVHWLNQNRPINIHFYTGFRGVIDAAYDEATTTYYDLFSTTEFLSLIANAAKKRSSFSETDLEQLKNNYLKDHLLCPPSMPLEQVKFHQALFDYCWNQFLTQRLWTKLADINQFTFEKLHHPITLYIKERYNPNVKEENPIVSIIGPEGAGKTAMVKTGELYQFSVIHEPARTLMLTKYAKVADPSKHPEWSRDIAELEQRGLKEAVARKAVTFTDRGFLCGIIFDVIIRGQEPDPGVVRQVNAGMKVGLYLNPIIYLKPHGTYVNDAQRTQTPQQAAYNGKVSKDTYKEVGYDVVELEAPKDEDPDVAILLRFQLMLQVVSAKIDKLKNTPTITAAAIKRTSSSSSQLP